MGEGLEGQLNNLPTVSVVVPSYKRHRDLVKRALDSLLNQTYQNIEIILVDDNAGEKLLPFRQENEELVKELNSDKLVFIKNERNLGGSGSRNEGIKAAKGQYITFLDDDDRYLPQKVERQLKFMIENNLDMCFTDLRMHNEKDQLIDYREYSKIKSFDKDSLFRYHLTRQIAGTPTFMYKKSSLLKIGLFDDVCMGQEFYLMAKTIEGGASIGYLKGSDVIGYRYDIEAISTGPNKIKGENLLYQYKRKFFGRLCLSERQYIRCRHWAVMAVAYKRNKKIFKALCYLVVSFLTGPQLAFSEFANLLRRRVKYNG
jgi:glycosyltransferase involved in cell wall biosynthesis